MAASTSTAAHSNNNSCYDVFISHRGPDVKKTFASHMYHRLIAYGLRVFLDYQELQEGAEFPCQIKGAIRTASVQIAIFSPTYADSQWCLDELVLMLETRAHIIPVFHHVKPTELRRTQGEGVYATSLRNLEKKRKYGSEPRYDSKTIENWRNALSRVADISGFDLDEGFNGDEGKLLDQLVKAVLEKGIRRLNVARYPTGLKEKVEDFETKLSLQGFVGITGLGGVGKTTLAKELFNKKSSTYSKSCFLSDVRERAKSSIPSLQRKLLKDLGASEEAIDSTDEGLEILRKHFSVLSDPVLLVLDDVDHHEQVQALLPVADKDIFPLPPSSLILITTRDNKVLIRSGVQEPSIYKLTGLNTERSRELFCSHAFSQPHPMQGFEDLVNQFLEACNGLPLSLKVFGGLLYGNNNKSYWKNELEELRKALPHDIQKSLQISYDALQPDEKQMFLDIACFFIGQSRDTAITVWKASGWNGSRGFEILLSKCLVELDIIVENPIDMYRIRMHDHLRDMGRYLANNTPGLPRMLWRGTKHIKDLLQQSSEATKVRGIRMLRSEHYSDERADSDEESADSDDDNELASYKMKNLQLLDIDMEEDHLKCLLDGMDSPNLLWFRWRNCRCSSLPPYIPMEKLRVLEVEGYEMETLWQEDSQTPFRLRELRISAYILKKIPKSIGQLKHLELMVVRIISTVQIPKEFCDLRSLKHLVLEIPELRSLPDSFGNLSKLEHINLSYCEDLERLPDSFGDLSSLQRIDLSFCEALQNLPDSFGNLSRLQHINLYKCRALERLPDSFGNLSKLEHINLTACHALERLPDSFGDLSSLQHIDLSCCDALQNLPDSFGNLSKLEHINLEEWRALERLPDSFGDLSSLQYINLSCEGNLEHDDLQYFGLKRLPDSFGNLSKLEHINLKGCCALERLPDSFGDLSSLQHIDLSHCDALQNLPDSFGNLSKLEHINLEERRALERLPDSFGDLSSLQYINLSCQRNLEYDVLQYFGLKRLPDSFGNLSNLEHINLTGCALERLPDSFGNLSKLEHIKLTGCCALERLPDSFGNLSSLQHIDLSYCEALQNLPDSFGNLSKLEHINLKEWRALERLPDSFGDLSSLQYINLSCEGNLAYVRYFGLKRLPDSFGNLSNLERINLTGCALERLPDSFGNLSKLEHIDLTGCRALERLPDSFGNLSKLEHIDLSLCALERLPDSFGNLSRLQHINLYKCRALERLPDSFGDLSSLQHIDLSYCDALQNLPDSFGNLSKLEHINLEEWRALERLPDSFGDLSSLQYINLSCKGNLKYDDLQYFGLKRLPDSFGNLSKLEHINLTGCCALERLPDSFGDLSSLQHINLSYCGALGRLPDSFGNLIKLKYINLWECHKLTIPGGTFRKLTLKYMRLPEWRIEVLPPQIAHQWSLEKLMLCLINMGEWPSATGESSHLEKLVLHTPFLEALPPSFGRDLRNLKYLELRSCQSLKRLPDSFLLMDQLIKLIVEDCPLQELHFETVEGASETMTDSGGQGTLSNLERGQLRLQHLELHKTQISEISFPTGVCNNLHSLDIRDCQDLVEVGTLPNALIKLQLIDCPKLRKIERLSGLAKLRTLGVSRCKEVEELPSIKDKSVALAESTGPRELNNSDFSFDNCLLHLQHLELRNTAISEVLYPTGVCPNLQYLDIKDCQDLVEVGTLPNALIKLQLTGCPELRKIALDVRRRKEVAELLSGKGKRDILTETTGQRTSGNLGSSFDKCLIRLQHFELDNTEISEVSFPAGVYPNLQYLSIEHGISLVKFVTSPDYILRKLDLWHCSKLRKIEELSGLAKLQVLSIAWCGVEELSSIETLGSLENLQVVRCSKLKSIRVLAKLTKLRELNVSNCSELEDLPGVEHLRSLEKLWACGCKKLKSIRGSAQLTQLRELDVSECSELEELLDIEHLRSLDKLRACNCARLKHLQGLAQLSQLRELDVTGCSRLEEMPGVGNGYLQSLVWLRASECVKLQSIQGLEQMAQLRELEVSYCFELKELLGVEHLKSLLNLQARSCRKLKNIQGLAQLTQLRQLDVSFCSELKEMSGVGCLQSLLVLRGSECVKLKSLWGLPGLTHLLELDVSGCCELEEMQGVGYLSSLMVLRACECVKLKSIQGLEQLTQLLKLDVSGCSELEELRGVGHLISLNMLQTSGCVKLKSIQVLEQLTQLLELHVCNCFELEELLGIEHLKSLKELLATNCKKLKSIQGLEQVTQLKYLDVSGCYELEKMPDVGCLESLVVLRASECVKLKSIQGLEQMTQLRELDVSYCFELEELPGFERLKSLMKLQARCCTKLKRIKGLAQLAQLRELDVSLCPELEERPDVECLQ